MAQKKLYRDTNLKIIFSVTLIAVLGVSSITPAFPKIIDTFNLNPQSIGLLITAFTLPGVILTPFTGILADRWGRKKIIIPSLILFGIAGVACAFTRDFTYLVGFRFVQGVGAASLGALNVTLIGDIYSAQERGTAMGYNASVLSIGTASYPAIGGALATLSWFYPFFLPIFAIPVALSVMLYLKNPEPKNKQSLKAYLVGVKQSITLPVVGLFLTSIFTFIILYGVYLTYYPVLIDGKFNGSTFIIGIIMSSVSVVTGITSSQLGRLLKHLSEKILLKIAFSTYTISLIITPFMPHLWLLLLPGFLFGFAQGINIPTFLNLLTGYAPMEHRAAFMSLNGMLLRLGQTLGPIFIGIFYGLWGLDATFFGGAIVALSMLALIFLLIK